MPISGKRSELWWFRTRLRIRKPSATLTQSIFYYDAIRVGGLADAESSLSGLFILGVVERNDLDSEFWKEVGRLKANNKASLADFCGVALTNRLEGVFLTADHHEFDKIADEGICKVQFIR